MRPARPRFVSRSLAASVAVLAVLGANACSDEPSKQRDARTGTPERITGPQEVELVARSQKPAKPEIIIDRAKLDAPGYAVVYADGGGAPGVRLGQSELLDAGVHTDLRVALDEVEPASAVWLMLHHEDNDNTSFDYPSADQPVPADNGVAVVRIALDPAAPEDAGG